MILIMLIRHTPRAPEPGQDAGAGAGAVKTETPAKSADVLALEERAAKAEAALAARLDADKKAADENKKKLADDGNHKALLEAQAQELEAAKKQLADLSADAALGKGWRESEQARIDAAAKEMPEDWKGLLDAAGDITAKSKVVALYAKTKGGTVEEKRTAVRGAQGTPAPISGIDFAKAFATPAGWADAKAKDPDGASAWMTSRMNPTNGASRPLAFIARQPTGANGATKK